MSHDLGVTGERLVEEQYRASLGGYVIYLMHAASYRFAEQYCHGKQVLDLGCGSGYGAYAIADKAKDVYAVDVSAEAIEYARRKYVKSNIKFGVIKPDKRLPFSDRSFDVVLSFQVIEHVENDVKYLAEAERVLRDDGVLVLITPDRQLRLFPGQRPWNRWHLREYSEEGLTRLMEERFQIERSLHMGACPDVANVEVKRYRILKWLTLPVTFPGVPEKWRRFGLDLIHRIRPQRMKTAAPVEPDFGVEDIVISPRVENSLNLILIGKPRRVSPDLANP